MRFFAYFIAGLQQVDTRLGKGIEEFLDEEQLPPADIILNTGYCLLTAQLFLMRI